MKRGCSRISLSLHPGYLIELIKTLIEQMDKRFDAVDKRFEAADKRFEAMQQQMDQRFDALTRRIDRFMVWSSATTLTVGGPAVAALKLWPPADP